MLTSFSCDVVNVAAVSPMSFAHHISFKYQGKVSEKFLIDRSKLIHTKDGIVVRDAYSTETEYNGSHSTFSAITPSEQINCAVLLICGTDDQYLNVEFKGSPNIWPNEQGWKGTIVQYLALSWCRTCD